MGKGISFPSFDGSQLRIALVVARWNHELTYALRDGAIEALKVAGIRDQDILMQEVPGSMELPFGAKHMIETQRPDAVIMLGVLIKGETMHFEYISESVAHGVSQLNCSHDIPVIYGVLNCLTEEQARVRSVGEHNHGRGWGNTAIEMALLAKNREKKTPN